jgi:hypothetical protein
MAEERGQDVSGGAQGEEDKYSSVLRGGGGAAQVKKTGSARGSGGNQGEKKPGASPTGKAARPASPVKPVSIFDTVDSGSWADEVEEEDGGGPTPSAPPPKNAWGVKPVFKNPSTAPSNASPPASSGGKVFEDLLICHRRVLFRLWKRLTRRQ